MSVVRCQIVHRRVMSCYITINIHLSVILDNKEGMISRIVHGERMIDCISRCDHDIQVDIENVLFVYSHEYRFVQTVDEFERVHVMYHIKNNSFERLHV